MMSQTWVAAVYQRILSINWHPDDSRRELYALLMLEHFRRTALWLKSLELRSPARPLFDLAESVDPTIRADSQIVETLRQHLNPFKINTRMEEVCQWALHWAALKDASKVETFRLPDPYEPLLVMFESGGSFRQGHEGIEIVGGLLPTRNWLEYAEHASFVELDR